MQFFFWGEVPSTHQLESKRQVEGQKFEFWQVTMLGSGSFFKPSIPPICPSKCHVSLPQKWDDPVFHLSIPDWILDVKMEGSKFSRGHPKKHGI